MNIPRILLLSASGFAFLLSIVVGAYPATLLFGLAIINIVVMSCRYDSL